MGNTQTLGNEFLQNDQIRLQESITYVGSKQHKYLGQIQLWKSKDDYKLWMFSKTTQIDVSDQVIQEEHNNRINVQHKNILKYYGTTIKSHHILQGNIKEIKVYYEYIPTTLTDYIKQHQSQNQTFHESYIWKFINEMSSVSGYLESMGFFHSDINSDSIFVERKGDFKIIFHGALPGVMSAYSKQFAGKSQRILSPSQMKELASNIVSPRDDPYKVDSYQFGFVLVQLMTRQDASCYNDYYKEVVHYQDILNLLGTSAKQYSPQLINLVAQLLQYHEQSRPRLSQLFQNQLYKQIPYKAQYIKPFHCFNVYQKNPQQQRVTSLPSQQQVIYSSPLKVHNRIQTYRSASKQSILLSSGSRTQMGYVTPQKHYSVARSLSYILSTKQPRSSLHTIKPKQQDFDVIY